MRAYIIQDRCNDGTKANSENCESNDWCHQRERCASGNKQPNRHEEDIVKRQSPSSFWVTLSAVGDRSGVVKAFLEGLERKAAVPTDVSERIWKIGTSLHESSNGKGTATEIYGTRICPSVPVTFRSNDQGEALLCAMASSGKVYQTIMRTKEYNLARKMIPYVKPLIKAERLSVRG